MASEKGLAAGNTTTLILKLLEEQDMYGYQMIETLAKRSDNTFNLKAGTLYPLLHGLENKGMVKSYEEKADSERVRKYYRITPKGKKLLQEKCMEWAAYSSAVNKVLNGGLRYGIV